MSSPPPPPQSQRGLLVFIAVMAVAFCLSLAALVYIVVSGDSRRAPPPSAPGPIIRIDPPTTSSDPLQPDEFALGLSIPPFAVVDQDEKPVTNDAFTGKVTVIDFFFTHCPFICPAMTGNLSKLTQTLKDVPEVQFLSFSVDPAHDTPSHLREYREFTRKNSDADVSRWRFLTGRQEVVWNILSSGLKWGVEERAEQPINLPDGSKMSNIRHPGWFALIGPDAKVLGVYQYDSEERQAELVQRIQAASRQLRSR